MLCGKKSRLERWVQKTFKNCIFYTEITHFLPYFVIFIEKVCFFVNFSV